MDFAVVTTSVVQESQGFKESDASWTVLLLDRGLCACAVSLLNHTHLVHEHKGSERLEPVGSQILYISKILGFSKVCFLMKPIGSNPRVSKTIYPPLFPLFLLFRYVSFPRPCITPFLHLQQIACLYTLTRFWTISSR